jgi:hypothetical protein
MRECTFVCKQLKASENENAKKKIENELLHQKIFFCCVKKNDFFCVAGFVVFFLLFSCEKVFVFLLLLFIFYSQFDGVH